MNGNVTTVADTGKTKVSMFGQAMTPGRVSKISKFSRPQ
jgi:flagella basal body P-ring formation protein FlgA